MRPSRSPIRPHESSYEIRSIGPRRSSNPSAGARRARQRLSRRPQARRADVRHVPITRPHGRPRQRRRTRPAQAGVSQKRRPPRTVRRRPGIAHVTHERPSERDPVRAAPPARADKIRRRSRADVCPVAPAAERTRPPPLHAGPLPAGRHRRRFNLGPGEHRCPFVRHSLCDAAPLAESMSWSRSWGGLDRPPARPYIRYGKVPRSMRISQTAARCRPPVLPLLLSLGVDHAEGARLACRDGDHRRRRQPERDGRARQRLRRPPLCSGPSGDTPGPLRLKRPIEPKGGLPTRYTRLGNAVRTTISGPRERADGHRSIRRPGIRQK